MSIPLTSIPPAGGKIPTSAADQADMLLDLVVEELRHLARQDRSCGILVTRTAPGRFCVELSDQVPYGLTWETGT
ncbi:hypothetical protein LVY72_22735 [Arthrobacter sp. I2-34]|uniref:Uncharacterized protein n=1 Tax=Arthrobacter hankyongi TaxID=2904801 RepID=A0ABS9LDE6_9MICC|nr:hypothetical protein [Arthrobacter hankyongi]MCG2624709.1 hypothetical protein [Arthrobacter hankyongi]